MFQTKKGIEQHIRKEIENKKKTFCSQFADNTRKYLFQFVFIGKSVNTETQERKKPDIKKPHFYLFKNEKSHTREHILVFHTQFFVVVVLKII